MGNSIYRVSIWVGCGKYSNKGRKMVEHFDNPSCFPMSCLALAYFLACIIPFFSLNSMSCKLKPGFSKYVLPVRIYQYHHPLIRNVNKKLFTYYRVEIICNAVIGSSCAAAPPNVFYTCSGVYGQLCTYYFYLLTLGRQTKQSGNCRWKSCHCWNGHSVHFHVYKELEVRRLGIQDGYDDFVVWHGLKNWELFLDPENPSSILSHFNFVASKEVFVYSLDLM